jgi:manganese-dependent inorganic pyrophosphatase
MGTTYILGHAQPDTDSVVAAMALEYLYSQKSCFGYTQPQAGVVDPINQETKYLFERFEVTPPAQVTASDIKPEDKLVLVDHNEASQRLPGLNETQIVDVIDHHKANLNLPAPIYMTFKTWGSSSTIVYYLMQQNQVKPDKKLASLMLAAILSDTVGFKSATTDSKDKEMAGELAQLAGINNIDAFTLDIFKAKSSISGLSTAQLATKDYKVFEFGGKKIFINQIETVEPEKIILEQKTALLEELGKIRQDMKLDLVLVAITDILHVNTKLLVPTTAEQMVAEKAFGGQILDHLLDIGPKLSRKKEIAPAIEQALV